MTTTIAKHADHYLVREFYTANPDKVEEYTFDSMQEALESRDEFQPEGTVAIAYVVFTDGTEQVIA